MAVNAHLRYVLCLSLTSVLLCSAISDLRLCGDEECKTQISEARTLIRYASSDPQILSFPSNTVVKIYSKSAGSNPDLWGVEIRGKRGYVPKNFIREQRIFIKMNDLKYEVPTENSSVDSAPKSTGTPSVQSSWATSALTQGINTIAEFTKEFPASLDKLSTSILRQMFTSAEAVSYQSDESVSTESIENVTIDASSIQSDSPVDKIVESTLNTESDQLEKSVSTKSIEKMTSDNSASATIQVSSIQSDSRNNNALPSSFAASVPKKRPKNLFLTCDLLEIPATCAYSFGSILTGFMMSKVDWRKRNQDVNPINELKIESELNETEQRNNTEHESDVIPKESQVGERDIPETNDDKMPTEVIYPAEEEDDDDDDDMAPEDDEDELIGVPPQLEQLGVPPQLEQLEASSEHSTEDQTTTTTSSEEFETKVIYTRTNTMINEENTDARARPSSFRSEVSEETDTIGDTEGELPIVVETVNELPIVDPETQYLDMLPSLDDLGKQLELVMQFLPESVQLTVNEHMKMEMPSRIKIFTSIVSVLFVLFFSIYFFMKTKSKERALVGRMCDLDRKLFVVTAERDVLKENADKISETAVGYEEKYIKVDERLLLVNEQLAAAKEENDALQDMVDELQEELTALQNSSDTLKSDFETKDKHLNELEEEHQIVKNNCKTLEDQVDSLQEELSIKLNSQDESGQRIASLDVQVSELQQSNCQLLEEAQVWNRRLQEIQQRIEILSKRNEEIESELLTKDKEIETLKETTMQLESLESQDESETKSERLQKLFDVSAISGELKATSTKLTVLQQDYDAKSNAYSRLEAHLDGVVAETESLKRQSLELKQERDEAVNKLHVLSDYFKGKEIELQKELGAQEAMRQQMEESALSVTEKADLYEKEVKLHRSHIDALKKEMDNQIRSYKTQMTLHESKAHENWLAARAAERRADEAKQEAAILRNKLTALEQETSKSDEMRTTPIRRDGDINGELSSPLLRREGLDLGRRIPFLPLDRPMPPPVPVGMPPMPPPFLGDRMPMMGPRPMFDLPPPMMPPFDSRPLPPRDFLPPGRRPPSPPLPTRDFLPPGRRPPSPPSNFNRRPPYGVGGPFRDGSPPRFYDRPNISHKQPSETQFGNAAAPRYPSPYSGPRKTASPPSDAGNTSV